MRETVFLSDLAKNMMANHTTNCEAMGISTYIVEMKKG